MTIPKTKLIIYMLFITIVLTVTFISFPKKIIINEEINIYKNGDPNFSKISNIRVEGKYDKNFFKEDNFRGHISIEGVINPQGELYEVKFSDGIGYLVYDNPTKGLGYFETLGMIVIDRNFNELSILIYELGDDSNYHISFETYEFTCYPSENRENSVNLLRELSKRDNWLSHLKVK